MPWSLTIYPPGAPRHPDSDPRPAPASEEPPRVSPSLADRQQKGKGGGWRAPPPRPTAAVGQSHGSIPGQARGARKGPPVPPPGLSGGRAGICGAAVPRGARGTGGEGGGEGEGSRPTGSRPGPPPTLRRTPSATARPRPPEAPRCARPIRRHRDASAAAGAAPAARSGPALPCLASPHLTSPCLA